MRHSQDAVRMQMPLRFKLQISKLQISQLQISKLQISKLQKSKHQISRLRISKLQISLLLIHTASATIYQFDDARPSLSTGGQIIQWHSGAASQLILSSLLVRAHPRGLMFRSQAWHLRDLSGLGWSPDGCVPSPHGLCQTEGSVIFPSDQAPLVGQDRSDVCPSASTGRVITNTTRYDASACDVIDARWDFFYAESTIWKSYTELPEWIYWTACVLVVYLVRCLSKYVLASLGKAGNDSAKQRPDPVLCLCACAACTILIVSQGDSCFVTTEDLLFYRFNVLYILAYAALYVGVRAARFVRISAAHDPPFYNLLAGVLQLVATRLYVGAETPYNPPLVFVVAVRALVKSRRGVDLLRCATLGLDSFMLALMCSLGFAPDRRYLAALFAGAAAWVDFLV